MVDVNIEFTRGVLFVRLTGLLNEISSFDVEEKVFEIIRDGGIRFIVFNTSNLIIKGNVPLSSTQRDELKQERGKSMKKILEMLRNF